MLSGFWEGLKKITLQQNLYYSKSLTLRLPAL